MDKENNKIIDEDKDIQIDHLNKIQRLKKELIILKSKDKKITDKDNTPKKLKALFKKKRKKTGYVVVEYLTTDYNINFKLCKVVSGNLVVVENKVHKLNPNNVWRLGKDSCYILREIDRNPVSNDDYEQVKRNGQDTDADVPLIKAVLGAIQKQNSLLENNKSAIIIVIIIIAVIAGIALFMR